MMSMVRMVMFILKSHSFPGLFNHKWDEVINKRCASALYIVANHEDCAFDRFLGKESSSFCSRYSLERSI